MLRYTFKEGFHVDGVFHQTRESQRELVTSDFIPDEICKMIDEYPAHFDGDDEIGLFEFSENFIVLYQLDAVLHRTSRKIAA